MDYIALTDDEAVALAVQGGTSWPSALNTVNDTSETELLAASERGLRSLVIRGLIDDKDLLPTAALQRLVYPMLQRSLALAVLVTYEDFTVAADGLALFYYQLDDENWVREVITSSGVHYLSVAASADCLATTEAMLASTVESGLIAPEAVTEGAYLPVYLCVAGKATDTLDTILARQGELSGQRTDVATGDITALGPPESLHAALAALSRSAA